MCASLRLGNRMIRAAVLASALGIGGGPMNAYAITEQEAQAIAVDAYVYFYPLVTMDVTRKQFTNIEPGKEFGSGPMNMFTNVPDVSACRLKGRRAAELRHALFHRVSGSDQRADGRLGPRHGRALLSPADARHVDGRVRVAGLAHDRNAGRQLPDRAARLEARSARQVRGVPAADGTQRIDAPTPYVWIIGRTKTDGPPDYDAVHKIQAGFKITPLSEWGKAPSRSR